VAKALMLAPKNLFLEKTESRNELKDIEEGMIEKNYWCDKFIKNRIL